MEAGHKTEWISSKMFDLKFFERVYEILDWREGKPFKIMNEHETFQARIHEQTVREESTQRKLCMEPNEVAIHNYVWNTYFTYFGLQNCFDRCKGYNQVRYCKVY
jgi:hypothetical protein